MTVIKERSLLNLSLYAVAVHKMAALEEVAPGDLCIATRRRMCFHEEDNSPSAGT